MKAQSWGSGCTGTGASRCGLILQVSYYVTDSFGTQMYNSCKVSRPVCWKSTAACSCNMCSQPTVVQLAEQEQ